MTMKLRPLSVIAVCLALITLVVKFRIESSRASATIPANAWPGSRTPEEYRRAPDNTFLTFPEWYLVYSPTEYANFLHDQPPSQFPYLGHLGQFWQGYRGVYQATKNTEPFNYEYHTMIWIIGTSTTVEYGLKWMYEMVFGQTAEALRGSEMTEEDRLAAKVAREYVNFLDVEPWYNFDFISPLKRLWKETNWWGANPLRKWERRYFLTSEYLVKAAYGWALKQAGEASYGVSAQVTGVVVDRAPAEPIASVKVIKKFDDGAVLAELPRYQAFTPAAAVLAKANVSFLEIAGNKGPILVTIIVPEDYEQSGVNILFAQPIITEPGRKRIAFTVNVPQLSETLRKLDIAQIKLEHVYDY
jgi:hypothetical protein